ncbi:MAG TPA: thioredoxin family protein [Aequorivita sp.]|jgi:thioredoxin-related protein|nr:thiol-disulfide isomerase [Aequorivita sp.]HBC05318.1 thioredoxin family protein [Aequorivita sp.]HNP68981.1 thioredoxin family protein [Aequorivita sp.]|tara:strand:+ start:8652 stop:9089 length:438 start_codon:yes stop_codon:yes gene_type:complete
MKKIIPLIVAIVFSITLSAQEWHTDFETAIQISSEENHPIILVFQGSDWCAPCIKLDREIWSTEEFKTYAKDHFVMLQADFPRKKKNALPDELQQKNNQLAEKYNKQGYFPFVVVLDKEGAILGEAGYENTTPTEYIKKLESFIN